MEKHKVTIYHRGMFGVRAIEAYLHSHGRRKYAQYEAAPFCEFTPKGKRKPAVICEGYAPSLLIVDGWNQPQPANPLQDMGDGCAVSRYSACDPRYQEEFDQMIAGTNVAIVADYREGR